MRDKNSKSEKLSRLLGEVDYSLIEESLCIDDEVKFKSISKEKRERKKQVKFPLFRMASVGAIALAVIIGIVAIFPKNGGGNSPIAGVGDQNNPIIDPDVDILETYPENTDEGLWDEVLGVDTLDKVNYFSAMHIMTSQLEDNDSVEFYQPIAPLFKVDGLISTPCFDVYRSEGFAVDESNMDTPNGSMDISSEVSSDKEYQSKGFGYEVESMPIEKESEMDYPSDSVGVSSEFKPQSTDTIIYYELSPNDVFEVYSVLYFKFNLTDSNSYLATKVGLGEIDVVITNNNIEPMITFRNGVNFFSCLSNGGGDNSAEFSTHKYIDGLYIVKNIEQENYAFEVCFSDADWVSNIKIYPFLEDDEEKKVSYDVTGDTFSSYVHYSFTLAQLEEYVSSGKLPEFDSGESVGKTESEIIPPPQYVSERVFASDTHEFYLSEDKVFVFVNKENWNLDYRKGYWENYGESILLVFLVDGEEVEKIEVFIVDEAFTYNGDVYYLV